MLPTLLALLACAPSAPDLPRVEPASTPPAELPAREAWAATAPLEGVQRLFVGPFRCALPDGRTVDFHPRGIARNAEGLRGRWTHRDQALTLEADGTSVTWAYTPWSAGGAWMLAAPEGVLACRPGHEGETAAAGPWVRVVDGGGDLATAGRALTTLELPLVVQEGHADGAGLRLRHAEGTDARPLAQRVADATGHPVTLEATAALDAPYELVVGP